MFNEVHRSNKKHFLLWKLPWCIHTCRRDIAYWPRNSSKENILHLISVPYCHLWLASQHLKESSNCLFLLMEWSNTNCRDTQKSRVSLKHKNHKYFSLNPTGTYLQTHSELYSNIRPPVNFISKHFYMLSNTCL